jgi:transcriptional regulator
MVVNAYGVPRIVEDEVAIYAHLEQLVQTHEASFVEPWDIDQAEEHVRALMHSIVTFEIPIRRLEGTFKLSQNKASADREAVIDALAASEGPAGRALAQVMRARA